MLFGASYVETQSTHVSDWLRWLKDGGWTEGTEGMAVLVVAWCFAVVLPVALWMGQTWIQEKLRNLDRMERDMVGHISCTTGDVELYV